MFQHLPAFLREPSKDIGPSTLCQAQSFPSPGAAPTRCWRLFPACGFKTWLTGRIPFRTSRAAQNIKHQPAINRLSRWGSQEPSSWVVQWLVLCGIPYRGSGALASPDPTNQHHNLLPTSLLGQAIRPPGGFSSHLQLSKSSTGHSCLQAATCLTARRPLATF